MKRGGPLKRFTRLETRTPLRARRPRVGGTHGSRSSKKAYVGPGTEAESLVASQGQHTPLVKFPKPARRGKSAPASIKRSSLKRKRARRIDRETPREKLYKSWIHTQPCCGFGKYSPLGKVHFCEGRIEQSHERNMTGLGLKSNNLRSVAMCGDFHDEWEENRGFFKNWGKELRRTWFSARVAEANERFDGEHPEAARAS